MRRISVYFYIFALCLFLIPFSSIDADAASMSDYCVVPPYVIQDVPPNVMIILDNSGSMFYFAYSDGFNTTTTSDDNDCSSSGNPCSGFLDPGTYPNFKYYGYFDPDEWYTYSSNRFVSAGSKSETRPGSSWDGNFLNWVTMRRVDIIRKVLTGGTTTSGEGHGYKRLKGEIADCGDRGKYKRMISVQDYTPYTGTQTFTVSDANRSCNGSGSGTSSFSVSGNTYNVAIKVPEPVEGVLQKVVGTRARLGLTFYNTNEGGYVQVPVAASNLASAVNQINLTRPTANTPLGETLWTMVGYFAQETSISGMGSGSGPRYDSGDYQVNNNNDPYNYGTGGSPRWPACSKSYILLITDGEPCSDGNLPATISNYASGKSIFNCAGSSCPAVTGASPETYSFPASTFPTCSAGNYVAGLEDVALWAHTTDLRNAGGSPDVGKDDMTGVQNLTLYLVNAFGKGSTLLRYAAINGGFEDSGSHVPDAQSEWDGNADGEPDNFYEAYEGYEIETAIKNALSSILTRASSGTAASVLASGEGSGANLIQAVFYPRRRFGNYIVGWTGENQNYWYYVDPFFTESSIREDTTSDDILNLTNDYIVQLYFDQDAQQTKARRFQDTDGNGSPDVTKPTVVLEKVLNLWKSGELLWSRDLSTDPRTIYTTCLSGGTCVGSTGFMDFSATNETTLRPYLQAADDTEADDIIRYLNGESLTTLLDEDGNIVSAGIDRDGDGADDYRPRYARIGGYTNVWKLGDVLDSTPRISSWIPLNSYDSVYNDQTYKSFTLTTGSTGYTERGMVFAGGNDGMLHAFKLGKLELSWSTQGTYEMARLSGTDIGREQWAFVPMQALPYLKYFMDPEYCHIYTVDLSPYIFDASIGAPGSGDISDVAKPSDGSTWRTILIGGMRLGGASKPVNANCSSATPNSVCAPTEVSGNSIGYSSYFALDVTDQNNPTLLWEFSNSQLGFATTGPAIIRIGSDVSKNGKWFVVFGSGSTGPIDSTEWQFLGRSDQNLRLFVLDLKTGTLLRTIDTGIQYAFGGSLLNATTDNELDYQDDAVYIGYSKRTGTSPNYTWTQGGVGRLFTKHDTNADHWVWRTLRDNIGPVTSSVTKLQNNKKNILWLFFGSGRYFFEQGTSTDDPDSQRDLFGIKEPCFTTGNVIDPDMTGDCQNTVSGLPGGLTDVTNTIPTENTANADGFKGWYINLDNTGNYTYCDAYNADGTCASSLTKAYRAERVITDPLATTTGLVFFTTYKPYNDECGLGGKSFIWAVRYNTGGAAGALLKGVALLQVSTGSIEQLDLSTAFTLAGGRKTSALEGVPPTAQGLSLLSTPPPVKRVLHMRER